MERLQDRGLHRTWLQEANANQQCQSPLQKTMATNKTLSFLFTSCNICPSNHFAELSNFATIALRLLSVYKLEFKLACWASSSSSFYTSSVISKDAARTRAQHPVTLTEFGLLAAARALMASWDWLLIGCFECDKLVMPSLVDDKRRNRCWTQPETSTLSLLRNRGFCLTFCIFSLTKFPRLPSVDKETI